jgi:hypothetical protein
MQEQRSGAAAGWIMFAGVVMITVGLFQAFAGIVALANDTFYVKTPEYVARFDATTWGRIHLILGLIVLACGFGVFSGNLFARTIGVFAALGSALAAFMWLPVAPVWGGIIIAIDIAVIWALTVHGRDLAEA